nr:ribonuclease H-like domain-containing protein [Tanacetum cinerariifolium]
MSSMGKLIFFLGLQVKQKEDGIFISQDKYVNEILNKFGFSDVKTASTPMETNKTLLKDEKREDCKKQTVIANSITEVEVKRLEKKRRSRTHRLKRLYKVGVSARVESSAEEQKDQGRFNDQEMFDIGVLDDEEVVVEKAVAIKEVNAA